MSIEEGFKQTNEIFDQLASLRQSMNEIIMSTYIYSWQWWFGMLLFVVPWIVWFIFRKKNSTARLLLGGSIAAILSIATEEVAATYGLWSYPITFLPAGPVLFLPYHFSVVPVIIMFTIQWFPQVSVFLKGVVLALFGAYVAMPLFEMIHLYDSKGWLYTYDFFLYLFIFLFAYGSTKISGFEDLQTQSRLNK